MKKVGILTYHDINNFGAQLQAYSLLTFLQQSGFQAELINYQPPRTRIRIIGTIIRPLLKLQLHQAIRLLRQRLTFIRSAAALGLTRRPSAFIKFQVISQARNFDALVCGSDELWNFTNYLGYLPAYILDVKFSKTKLSYAASIGDCQRSPELDSVFRRALSNFSSVLVRDSHTREMVESLGLRAQEVVDPTFLIEQPFAAAKRAPYIMVSGALTGAQIAEVRLLSQKTGLPIVSPGYRYAGLEDAFIEASPAEWVSLIYGATYHVTSLFHGAAFSMKCGVPFCAFLTPGKEGKIGHMMQWFGIENRLVPISATAEQLLEVLKKPYPEKFYARKNELVRQSKQHLLKALEEV